MLYIRSDTTQNQFLHDYLRGNGKTLTEYEAREFFGIQNLRARATELRQAGLVVRTVDTPRGTAYAISERDVYGNRGRLVLS